MERVELRQRTVGRAAYKSTLIIVVKFSVTNSSVARVGSGATVRQQDKDDKVGQ